MDNVLNKNDYIENIRNVITFQLLENAKKVGLIDDITARQIMKELKKVEVLDYAS